ncbi:MAG TPA: phosphoenolpyruvate carboxylase [Acetobacteraceae bacterium]|nr:phosphoenolpyruvate carboxylase [Acetobacteraceae bacterium]
MAPDLPASSVLLGLVAHHLARADADPFGNPVLSVSLAITRMMDEDRLALPQIAAAVRELRDLAFAARARRLARYVGGTDEAANTAALAAVARNVLRPDPADSPVPWARFRECVERPRYAAVFTAHPTFALSPETYAALAEAACGAPAPPPPLGSHRPGPITLDQEFARATAAISHGRDALDRLNAALLECARGAWPDRWTELAPRPVILASWVGYDTDGRTDITWADTLRLRLQMKLLQLERLRDQLAPIEAAAPLAARTREACAAVARQLEACRDADPPAVAVFARTLLAERDAALTGTATLRDLFAAAIAAAPPEDQLRLAVARAGLVSHGLSLAHTHVRLNAAQLHNAIRQRLGITDAPEDPAHRRALLAAINAALDEVAPIPVDFGGVLAEQASAARLMMVVAQIVKHIDGSAPVRFLIAETESGYTLLAALWLARLFGVERHVEISPLFETAEALESGARVLEEALRSPHYRAYLQATGRLALQFGYSDSGRYIGQTAASHLIERLRFKIAETLARFGVAGVEVVLFDTHGESVGRGAHPGSLAERLKYLSPTASRQALGRANLPVREESAFQGGDGYLLFATPALALATVARIAEHAFHPAAGPIEDPIYADPDFVADFFATVRTSMQDLVEDQGYAALLGVFGPSLIDRTGSRPPARQADGMAAATRISHPRELRAIPNNAILQQLGWCANTLQGIGTAAARNPETFAEMRHASRRFRRALELAQHALAHSDLDVLRATVGTLDPGTWLNRAARTTRPGRREALVAVARALERLGLWAAVVAMFRRVQADHLALRAAWPDCPRMEAREVLLHALRLALIQRIWLLAAEIPDFSPRHGVTRLGLEAALLRLDVPAALDLLAQVFPAAPDPVAEQDYGEPPAPRESAAYRREHERLLQPIGALFALVREIATAVTHEVGAFG